MGSLGRWGSLHFPERQRDFSFTKGCDDDDGDDDDDDHDDDDDDDDDDDGTQCWLCMMHHDMYMDASAVEVQQFGKETSIWRLYETMLSHF